MIDPATLTVDALATTPVEDLVEQFVAMDPSAFRRKFLSADRAGLEASREEYAQTFGWRPPAELDVLNAIDAALGLEEGSDGYHGSGDLTLRSNWYVNLLPEDDGQSRGGFLRHDADVLFAGLYRLVDDAAGNRVLFSVLPDPGEQLTLHPFHHERGTLGAPTTLRSFFLTHWLSEDGPEPGSPARFVGDLYAHLHEVADAYDLRVEESRAATHPAQLRSKALFERTRWLRRLLWGREATASVLSAAPDFATWEREREALVSTPVLACYWPLAHYFLGNEDACREAVSLAARSGSTFAREVAREVEPWLHDAGRAQVCELGPDRLQALRKAAIASAPHALRG